jgi:hypothetical protein
VGILNEGKYKFMITSPSVLLGMKYVSGKFVDKIRHTFSVQ